MAHHARILAKARAGGSKASRPSWNAVADDDEPVEAIAHRPAPRRPDSIEPNGGATRQFPWPAQPVAGPSRLPPTQQTWPPNRAPKRPRSPPLNGSATAAENSVIDVDASSPRGERVELAEAKCDIVGVGFYPGLYKVTPDCIIKLRRDPKNAHDPNAIETHTVDGTKIGHIPRAMASRLAPLMDSGELKVRAKCRDFTGRPSQLPVMLKFFGAPSLLDDYRFKWAKPAAADAPRYYNAHPPPPAYHNGIGSHGLPPTQTVDRGLAGLTAGLNAVDRSVHRPDTLSTLFSEFDPSTLPLHDQPDMKTKLLPHQLQALGWMTRQEHPQLPTDDKPVQLWQKRKNGDYCHVATGGIASEPPTLGRGGCLADEMGLGKTLAAIALIASPADGSAFLEAPGDVDTETHCDTTLVVCPLSVVANWRLQLKQHAGKRLSIHVYHGDGRELSRKDLVRKEVVITTYQTLAAEHLPDDASAAKKRRLRDGGQSKNGKLHRIKWRRVILDEGHTIRNHRTQQSKACRALVAERRWSLTGTPLINNTKDLAAMLHFLRLCAPLDDPQLFSKHVDRNKTGGRAILLRACISAATLRRTKDMKGADGQPLVKLPQLTVYLHKVALDPAARAVYDEIEGAIQTSVVRTIQQGDAQRAYSAMLVFLLRLRQIACHPALCPQAFVDEVRAGLAQLEVAGEGEAPGGDGGGGGAAALTPAEREALQRTLLELRYEDCSICFEGSPEDPVITLCKHVFCSACITQVIDHALGQDKRPDCPMCRAPIRKDGLVALPDEPLPAVGESREGTVDAAADVDSDATIDVDDEVEADPASGEDVVLSAKTRELIKLLEGAAREDPPARSLVFSQWTTHLDRIGEALDAASISYSRFDGKMAIKKRDAVVEAFQSGKGPGVMLLSLQCGALGLNLTAASVVVLMDPWWQASIEQQAIDRTYRIGQQRDVRVFQLVAENTVEQRVLDIQNRKQTAIADAFAGIRGATTSRNKVEGRLQDMLQAFNLDGRVVARAMAEARDGED